MRLSYLFFLFCTALAFSPFAAASPSPKPPKEAGNSSVQVTADQSLEYYSEKKLYVARGNAKSVRGTMTVTGDILTAHERDKPAGAPKRAKTDDKNGSGDIDIMTAEGHVVIVDPKQRITGEHAVYDLDKHTIIVTGSNLRYETAKEVVTATDSLEYNETTKLAVARGHAVADQPDRHIEGDVLTAEFRDAPNGQTQLTKMTAQGHVSVITRSKDEGEKNGKPIKKGGDVSRGDRAVYDAGSNMAILTGDVKVTKSDGTQMSGDVGEVNFTNNQSRLLTDGSTRVKALLPPKTSDKDKNASSLSSPSPSNTDSDDTDDKP
jgi:lipopolysaccharide export system protein LptA